APAQLHGLSDERTTENTVVFLRFDLKASEAQTLTLRLDGRWDSQQPTRVSTLGLPPTGGTRTERAGGVMAALTSHFAGSLINEVRGYLSADRKDATALVTVPAGRVQVASDLPDGRQGVATLAFGSNSGLPQRVDNVGLELSEELSWLPGGGAHRPASALCGPVGVGREENRPRCAVAWATSRAPRPRRCMGRHWGRPDSPTPRRSSCAWDRSSRPRTGCNMPRIHPRSRGSART